jgi:hypothetical protein
MFKNVLFTFLLLVVAPVFGQASDVWETHGLYNGRWWLENTDYLARSAYIRGVVQAVILARPESKLYETVIPGKMTFAEMIRAIDGFYQEPVNGRISIMGALQVIKYKFEGEPAAVIEMALAQWRKTSADVEPPTPEVTKQ